MKPALYRYRDSESVIKPMDGYTPGEGWEPLYDKAALEAAVAAERERCANLVDPKDYAAWEILGGEEGIELLKNCADAIRKGK